MEMYRDFRINYDCKPIPIRCLDWEYSHIDYDGAPDAEDYRYGTASTLEEVKQEINEWYEEQEEINKGISK